MPFQIRNTTARPGEFVHGQFEVDGVGLPLVIGAGPEDGPTLVIVCAQHRTEFSGPAVAHKFISEFDLGRLCGTVVILPLTSLLQVLSTREIDTHREKFDEGALEAIGSTNMNRVWPGKADGNFIERSAFFIYEEICRRADGVLDFHCCRNADGRFTAASEGHQPSIDLAKAFGWRVIDEASNVALEKGLLYIEGGPDLDIPVILVETYPGSSQVIPETVAACYQGVLNTLVHLGMMDGDLVLPPTQTIFRRADPVEVLKAEATGFLGLFKEPADVVKTGDLIGVIRSPDTFEVVQEIRAPRDGALPSVGPGTGNHLVLPGEEVCTIKRVHAFIENG